MSTRHSSPVYICDSCMSETLSPIHWLKLENMLGNSWNDSEPWLNERHYCQRCAGEINEFVAKKTLANMGKTA